MKIVFLDFDGVLNSERYVRNSEGFGPAIDPSRMILLKQIIDATGAKIVLSTSWREHWSPNINECDKMGILINDIFKQHGLEIFSKTPKLCISRELEIKLWLDSHTNIENFVILDDMVLSDTHLNGHFIKTSNYINGLDQTDVQSAIAILNSEHQQNID